MFLIFRPQYENTTITYSLENAIIVENVDSFVDCLSTICDIAIPSEEIKNSNLIIHNFKDRHNLYAPCDYQSGLSVVEVLVADSKGEFCMSLRRLEQSEIRYVACIALVEQYILEISSDLMDSEKDLFTKFGADK